MTIKNTRTLEMYTATDFGVHGWQFAQFDGDKVVAILSLGGTGSSRPTLEDLLSAINHRRGFERC